MSESQDSNGVSHHPATWTLLVLVVVIGATAVIIGGSLWVGLRRCVTKVRVLRETL